MHAKETVKYRNKHYGSSSAGHQIPLLRISWQTPEDRFSDRIAVC